MTFSNLWLFCVFLLAAPVEQHVEKATAKPKIQRERAIAAADRAHWAFRPPQAQQLPAVRGPWVRNPIDVFVLARLEKAGLEPSRPADKPTLLRRVTFDVTGLPPTPEQIESFLRDDRPDAYERVVDGLLASPHYGERWAQHWLDVVRYADSNGYEADGDRPHAWRYRDYVIRAFNQDLPFDRFLTEQLAGDELAQAKDNGKDAELLIASGFNRCGPVHLVSGNTDPEVNRQEVLTEMTTGVASAFLGLTLGCARCHDHKFDPISQADYYRMQSFFAAAQPRDIDISTADEKARLVRQDREIDARIAPLQKQLAELEAPFRARLEADKKARLEKKYRDALAVEPAKRTPQQRKLAEDAMPLLEIKWNELVDALKPEERARRAAWRAQIHDLEAKKPPPASEAWTIRDRETIPPTNILLRGDPRRKGPVVEPAFPRVLVSGTGANASGSGPLDRVALARWLVKPDHPLTARVLVNRLWQHHFGRGLVATPNDFGLRGDRPSHPELLDWLAREFVAHGWSLKHMHRLMVLSSTYRQSSRAADAAGNKVDPDNRLLWHMNRQRLEGEAFRDTVLAVSGELNPELGGPQVRVPLEPEVYELIFTEGERDGLWLVTPDRREHARRTIYLLAKRNVRLPLLEALDRPDFVTSCPVRPVSTFAPQALILLNGPFLQGYSKRMAVRLMRECGMGADPQIDRAYWLTVGRPPGTAEREAARQFLQGQAELIRARLRSGQPVNAPADLPEQVDRAAVAALADFCLALLNRNEFVYIN
jgi:Protein of unknown function (DUF1553)/Protein of unknown function (DUF1549)